MNEEIFKDMEHERSAAVIERRRLEKELETTTAISRKLTDRHIKEINTLRFCFDEVLGELGWGDEIEETGIDPLVWARGEIKRLQNREKSLQLRDAANAARFTENQLFTVMFVERSNKTPANKACT